MWPIDTGQSHWDDVIAVGGAVDRGFGPGIGKTIRFFGPAARFWALRNRKKGNDFAASISGLKP